MSNESPYGGQDPHPSHDWTPEPPAPPATWSPYGFQTSGETTDDTRPFGFGAPAEGPATPPEAPQQQKRTRSRGLAASVVAASLLVGGAAGVAGAAVWTSTHDNAVASSPIVTQSGSSAVPAAATGSIEKVAANVLPSVVKINVSGSSGSGSGSGHHPERRRQDPDQQPRRLPGRQGRPDQHRLQRRLARPGQGPRHRPAHRHRGRAGRGRHRPHAGDHRPLLQPPGRSGRGGDRFAVRPRRHRHQRHRQRPQPARSTSARSAPAT